MSKAKKQEAMCFRFRWFDTLDCLPEAELRQMLKAIRAYAEADQAPEFTGIMSALWNEIRDCIDFDKKQYSDKCEQARKNVAKRYQKDTDEYGSIQTNTDEYESIQTNTDEYESIQTATDDCGRLRKATIGEGERKETYPTDMQRKEIFFETNAEKNDEKDGNVIVLKPVDFTKWSREEFIGSVYAAIGKNEAYAEFREEFCRYWLEPDKKGRFRFALQKTWSTAGRLATWSQKAATKFPARVPQASPVLSAAEQIRQLQEG